MKICPSCGASNHDFATYCPQCGASIGPGVRGPEAANYGMPPGGYSYSGNMTRPEDLPPRLRPVKAWAYVGYDILFAVPLIGFIFMIVFAVSDENVNRRNYARSYFCKMLLVLGVFLLIFLIALITGSLGALSDRVQNIGRY